MGKVESRPGVLVLLNFCSKAFLDFVFRHSACMIETAHACICCSALEFDRGKSLAMLQSTIITVLISRNSLSYANHARRTSASFRCIGKVLRLIC